MKKIDNKEMFKSNVLYYRTRKGLSQEELADLCGCSQMTISNMESNLKSPTLRQTYIVAKALGVCPFKLYDVEDLDFCNCKECDRFKFIKID